MKLTRASFLAALVCGLATAGTAQSQEPVVLKFSHEAPETAIKGRTAVYFADKVKEYSKGTLSVEVFPGASLIPTKDEVRAVIRGQVDIIAPQTSYYTPFNAAWDVFYQPLLFNSPKEGMDMLAGDLGRELLGTLDKVGLKGMGIWHDGPGYLFVKEKPVTKPSELQGRKIRLFPSAPLEEGVRAAGGIPVSVPAPDVYLGLQQGMIEGVISAVTFAAPSRWYEVVKGSTRMTMFVGGYGVVINKNRWNKLSPEHQDVVQRAMKDAEKWNYDISVENIAASEKLLLDNGVTLADLSAEDLAEWRKLMAPIYEKQPAEVRELIKRVQNQQ
jgi:C4-dicarboxylate-binding protein DctP